MSAGRPFAEDLRWRQCLHRWVVLRIQVIALPLPPPCAERVPGTEWLEVTCDDGKKYFHNPKTDETTWHVPPEVGRPRWLVGAPAELPLR